MLKVTWPAIMAAAEFYISGKYGIHEVAYKYTYENGFEQLITFRDVLEHFVLLKQLTDLKELAAFHNDPIIKSRMEYLGLK